MSLSCQYAFIASMDKMIVIVDLRIQSICVACTMVNNYIEFGDFFVVLSDYLW